MCYWAERFQECLGDALLLLISSRSDEEDELLLPTIQQQTNSSRSYPTLNLLPLGWACNARSLSLAWAHIHMITRPCNCMEQVTGGLVHWENDRVAIGRILIVFVCITQCADVCVRVYALEVWRGVRSVWDVKLKRQGQWDKCHCFEQKESQVHSHRESFSNHSEYWRGYYCLLNYTA